MVSICWEFSTNRDDWVYDFEAVIYGTRQISLPNTYYNEI